MDVVNNNIYKGNLMDTLTKEIVQELNKTKSKETKELIKAFLEKPKNPYKSKGQYLIRSGKVKQTKLDKDACVFTARAFAPLIKILDYVYRQNCRLFLLKGREIQNEISVAKQKYKFDYDLIPSKTGDGYILVVSNKQ